MTVTALGYPRVCEGCGGGFTVAEKWKRERFCTRSCANKRPRRKRSVAERFWPKVNKDGPLPAHRPELGRCWIWTASRTSTGYGQISDADRTLIPAHRWAWEQVNDLVPDGLDLDHLCRVREGVRPDHLQPVTRAVNAQRGLKGDLKPPTPLREKCANGHDMTPENRFLRTDGPREKYGCRRCMADAQQRYYARKRGAA